MKVVEEAAGTRQKRKRRTEQHEGGEAERVNKTNTSKKIVEEWRRAKTCHGEAKEEGEGRAHESRRGKKDVGIIIKLILA